MHIANLALHRWHYPRHFPEGFVNTSGVDWCDEFGKFCVMRGINKAPSDENHRLTYLSLELTFNAGALFPSVCGLVMSIQAGRAQAAL